MAKKPINLTMDDDLIDRVDSYCKDSGRTRSGYISMLVEKDLKKEVDEDDEKSSTEEINNSEE